MSRELRRTLPFHEWPASDQAAFQRAFRRVENPFVDEEGAGAHLRASSIALAREGYGRFLRFLGNNDPAALSAEPVRRVTRERIEQYTKTLSAISLTTRSLYIRAIYDAMRYMEPEHDWRWLRKIVTRLEALARPQPRPLQIDAACLQGVGLAMIQEAKHRLPEAGALRRQQLREVCQLWRDGLLIVFLTVLPLRRANIAKLEIGSELRRVNGTWYVEFAAADTKSRRPIESQLPHWFGEYVDEYLTNVRPLFPDSTTHRSLWPSWRSRPLPAGPIYAIFVRRMKERTGLKLRLHDVRAIAATTLIIAEPSKAAAASTLLSHIDPRITEKHYVKAHTVEAARVLSDLVRQKTGGGAVSKP